MATRFRVKPSFSGDIKDQPSADGFSTSSKTVRDDIVWLRPLRLQKSYHFFII